MAKVKIKIGENEVEVDSRDFYVDNESIGQVIEEVSRHLQSSSASLVYVQADDTSQLSGQTSLESLRSLEDAEVHEPEFSGPAQVSGTEVRSKLEALERDSFFDAPRTVSETVAQLREYGWIASPLEVSKTLAKMALRRELTKDSQNDRNYYAVKQSLLAS